MTATAQSTETVAFALRTHDERWIARNHAVIGEAERVFVQVPAGEIEQTTLCGQPMLRHRFADCPKDFPNAWVVCPAIWVPETAALLASA